MPRNTQLAREYAARTRAQKESAEQEIAAIMEPIYAATEQVGHVVVSQEVAAPQTIAEHPTAIPAAPENTTRQN